MRTLSLLFGALLLLTACGGGGPSEGRAPPAEFRTEVVGLKMGEYFFEPATIVVRSRAITFNVSNVSEELGHTFVIKNLAGEGDLAGVGEVAPGLSATLQVNVGPAGMYQVYCRLPGHLEQGMKATLAVQGS